MNSIETIIKDIYIKDGDVFDIYKNQILELYPNSKMSPSFRMTINEIENKRKYTRISGIVLSGVIIPGETIKILPEGLIATVLACSNKEVISGKPLAINIAPVSKLNITGMISTAKNPQQTGMLFRVKICWFSEQAPIVHRRYAFMFGRQRICGSIIKIKDFSDILKHYKCDILLDGCIAFDSASENPISGTFIIDSEDKNRLCGIGAIEYALRRGSNIHQQFSDISKEARAIIKTQKPCVLWLTGISGAGKSTIANAVEKKLYQRGYHTYLLDGDNIRPGLNRDLGFSEEDRVENIRRIAEVAYLMADAGLIVIAATISPFKSDRAMVRRLFTKGEFFEIYVDTPLSLAETRDPKGLYVKARNGEIKNFTGIDSPYEPPNNPEIRIDTSYDSIKTATSKIIMMLFSHGVIDKNRFENL